MIEFLSQTDFKLQNEKDISKWIAAIIDKEGFLEGDISYFFCDDEYLFNLNKEFLQHESLTDIISFDYSLGNLINGEVYISVERVAENAELYQTNFETELHRVMIHGIYHYCGFKDKTDNEIKVMRSKENEALARLRIS